MTELKEYSKIDWKYYDSNYTVSCSDIEITTIVNGQSVESLDPKTLKVVLYLLGLDTAKDYERLLLPEGGSYRSELTDTVQQGGFIFSGKQRTDTRWKKLGFQGISIPYLFGNKVKELKEVINASSL